MENELYHYGVLGMKWGVRRYENYDGSYTQRGVKRYKAASEKYERAKSKLNEAKKTQDKSFIKTAKRNVKDSKSELNKSYKRLSMDKKADQGKRLYQKGKTISGNYRVNAIAQTGIVVGSRVVSSFIASKGNTKYATLAGAAIGIGGTAVNAILAGKTNYENKRLRAYYGHS